MIKTPNKLGIEGYFLHRIRTPTKSAQLILYLGFPDGSDGKESSCSVGYLDSIPGLGRSLGGGHDNPLQPGESPWTEEPGGLPSMGLQSRTQLSG